MDYAQMVTPLLSRAINSRGLKDLTSNRKTSMTRKQSSRGSCVV